MSLNAIFEDEISSKNYGIYDSKVMKLRVFHLFISNLMLYFIGTSYFDFETNFI